MKVGVLGAGQLGQMLGQAGRRLGFDFRFLAPDENAPAGRHAELIVATSMPSQKCASAASFK